MRPPKAIAQTANQAQPNATRRSRRTSSAGRAAPGCRRPQPPAPPRRRPAASACAGRGGAKPAAHRRRTWRPPSMSGRWGTTARASPQRVQSRPGAVDQALHDDGGERVTECDNEQERHDPAAGCAHQLDRGDERQNHDHPGGRTQIGDQVQQPGRRGAAWARRPVGGGTSRPATSVRWSRSSSASTPTSNAPPITTTSATVSASPLASSGSSRRRSSLRRPACSAASSSTARAGVAENGRQSRGHRVGGQSTRQRDHDQDEERHVPTFAHPRCRETFLL